MSIQGLWLPLVTPFRTSFGVQTGRDVILVHIVADGVDGWGENVAGVEPLYSSEFTDASILALRHHLVPRLLSAGDITAARVAAAWRAWRKKTCSSPSSRSIASASRRP